MSLLGRVVVKGTGGMGLVLGTLGLAVAEVDYQLEVASG